MRCSWRLRGGSAGRIVLDRTVRAQWGEIDDPANEPGRPRDGGARFASALLERGSVLAHQLAGAGHVPSSARERDQTQAENPVTT